MKYFFGTPDRTVVVNLRKYNDLLVPNNAGNYNQSLQLGNGRVGYSKSLIAWLVAKKEQGGNADIPSQLIDEQRR